MEEGIRARLTSTKTLRDFGLLMAFMIAAIFGVLIPLLKSRSLPLAPWVIAAAFAALALLYPKSLSLIHRWWMKLGRVLGLINSRILLTLLFWTVITPLALLFRLFRRDILNLRADPDVSTYRVPASSTNPKEGMERPF